MARIERLEKRDVGSGKAHGPVVGGYQWFEVGGVTIFQLDTYGSLERKEPGKVSQSVQLDLDGARRLVSVLKQAFPEL